MSTSVPSIGDMYCRTLDEAFKEVARRKRDAGADGVITRFEESPYGGYRVYSLPADVLVDDLVDPIINMPDIRGSRRKRVYR